MDLMGRQVHTAEIDTLHVSDDGDATSVMTHRAVQSETFSGWSCGVDDYPASIAGAVVHGLGRHAEIDPLTASVVYGPVT